MSSLNYSRENLEKHVTFREEYEYSRKEEKKIRCNIFQVNIMYCVQVFPF
jgi:hypothetical protein